jgi:hypothetical protein
VLADALVQAHARPHRAPTGAKDLNLAFADVRVLLPAFLGTDPTARRSLGRFS